MIRRCVICGHFIPTKYRSSSRRRIKLCPDKKCKDESNKRRLEKALKKNKESGLQERLRRQALLIYKNFEKEEKTARPTWHRSPFAKKTTY